MYARTIDLNALPAESCFLRGARQTRTSTLLKAVFPGAMYFDLLLLGGQIVG